MPRLAQYDYLMAIGTIFSLLDAYNIGGECLQWSLRPLDVGSENLRVRQSDRRLILWHFRTANDVANSWATSVSSRSVSMRQALGLAALMEFLGAVTVGGQSGYLLSKGKRRLTLFFSKSGRHHQKRHHPEDRV